MDSIPISKFKATCLALIERVRATGQPLLITKRGEPVAQVVPPPAPEPPEDGTFGSMEGTARELEDIVAPLPLEDWEGLA